MPYMIYTDGFLAFNYDLLFVTSFSFSFKVVQNQIIYHQAQCGMALISHYASLTLCFVCPSQIEFG